MNQGNFLLPEIEGRNFALLQRVNRFIYLPSIYVDESWLWEDGRELLPAKAITMLRKKRSFSQFCIEHFGLGNELPEQAIGRPWYLVFLDQAPLLQLLLYLGAISFREQIQGIVEGTKLRRLKLVLGSDVLSFSRRRLSFFYRETDILKRTEELSCDDENSMRTQIVQGGTRWFEACLDSAPRGFKARFMLKFPRSWKWTFGTSSAAQPGLSEPAWSLICRVLREEIGSDQDQWLPSE
jgi:YOP proteins translocation protein K (YscK)